MNLTKSYILTLLITLFFNCIENKETTIITVEEGKIGMIGYGSLMSKKSMEHTLKRKYEDSIYLVHLQGYKRAWNYYTPINSPSKEFFYLHESDTIPIHNSLSLNIMDSENEKINCVLFFITPEELVEFDKRELVYKRIDVTDKIEELQFEGGSVYAYKAEPEHTYYYHQENNTVLPKRYLELVTNACDSIGKSFRDEFESSTKPYNKETVVSKSNIISKTKK